MRKNIIIVVLGVVFGIAVVFGYRAVLAGVKALDSGKYYPVTAADASGTIAYADSVAKPAYLIIPSINVDAPVVDVGLAASGDGDLGVPNDAIHVAWYKNGPVPGAPGAAVIDGHLDTVNTAEAVFYNLDELQVGDTIQVVTTAGETLTFKVTKTEAIPYDAVATDIFQTTSNVPQLNLITCAGDWMSSKKLYNERYVVFSQLVSTTPATSTPSSSSS